MDPTAETTAGKVLGLIEEGVLAFRTIPYAQAARFQSPRPPEPWSGTRDCRSFAGRAPQAGVAPVPRAELADFSGAPDPSPETEDCLTVNVWTPAADRTAARPVMVWFHGGAFSFGNA